MVEVLVTLVIVQIGLVGLLSVQARAHQAEIEVYQRAQALIVLQDMADRINANRGAAPCFAITTSAGSPAWGSGSTLSVTCAATGTSADAAAVSSINQWHAMLLGTGETAGPVNIGAMVGARGCVALDPGSAAATPPTPDTYTIAVAWQGLSSTVKPSVPAGASIGTQNAVACGQNLYGAEDAWRRVVWTTLSIARLK